MYFLCVNMWQYADYAYHFIFGHHMKIVIALVRNFCVGITPVLVCFQF